MTRILVPVVALLALLLPSSVFAGETLPAEVEKFLGSRQVLGTVHFDEGRADLSPEGRETIDRLIPRLKGVEPSVSLVRIEGFASANGNDSVNVPISMSRARAVIDYIRERYPLSADLFLTGFGERDVFSASNAQGCRAEIAIYDNIWQMKNLSVEKVVQR